MYENFKFHIKSKIEKQSSEICESLELKNVNVNIQILKCDIYNRDLQ